MKLLNILLVLLVTVLLCSNICAGVFLPLLKGLKKKLIYGSYAPSYGYRSSHFGYGHGYYGIGYGNARYGARPYSPQRFRDRRKRTGRTYGDIARVINPNPYVFVGSRPYPGQPFYPQG